MRATPLNFVIIGNPGSRRVELFQAALAHCGLPPARLVAYADLLAQRVALPDVVQSGDVVRIESPGRDWAIEQALLALGAEAARAENSEADHFACLAPEQVAELRFERGRIWPSRQWYLGWRAALDNMERQLAHCAPHRLMNAPGDIAVMFDKIACHERLETAGVPVPRSLGSPANFDDLEQRIREMGCQRVFIKLAHGSSAAGVVAYRTNGQQHQAVTTTEMIHEGGQLRLYNSRCIRTYHNLQEIRELVDALCQHRVHVEQWLPKAGWQNCVLDLRVVVLAGQAQHTVTRLSRSPLTNLHLLNQRADSAPVRARMGEANWQAALRSCEQAMECFPNSLYAGVDLLISPNYYEHAILEVNAFGDLLPALLWDGVDTYTAQIKAIQNSC